MMSKYYCHNCAIKLGIPASASTERLFDTKYQFEKYIKHTAPGTAYPINSIFLSPGTAQYADYIINTLGSGWYQIDDQGRHNMAWYAGKQIGVEYRGGTFHIPASGVRVVCYYDEFKIHAFPDAYTVPSTTCSRCATPIPYEI